MRGTSTILHWPKEIFGNFHEARKSKVEMELGEKPITQPPPHCPQQEWEQLKAYWIYSKSIEKATMSCPHSFMVYLKMNHIAAFFFLNIFS